MANFSHFSPSMQDEIGKILYENSMECSSFFMFATLTDWMRSCETPYAIKLSLHNYYSIGFATISTNDSDSL